MEPFIIYHNKEKFMSDNGCFLPCPCSMQLRYVLLEGQKSYDSPLEEAEPLPQTSGAPPEQLPPLVSRFPGKPQWASPFQRVEDQVETE